MDTTQTPDITPEMLQANPGLSIALVMFTLLFLLAVFGSITSWVVVGVAWSKGKTMLGVLPWKPRPWGFIEIVLAMITMIAAQVLVVAASLPLLGIDPKTLQGGEGEAGAMPLSLTAAISGSYFVTIVVICVWILLRYRCPIEVLGWSLKRLPKMVLVGIVAGLMFLPFMFAINLIVTLTSEVPYEHPVLDAMAEDGSAVSFLLACFSAVLVAPIAEEFLFRVLLQGWLQSIPFVSPVEAIVGRFSSSLSAGPLAPIEAVVLEPGSESASPLESMASSKVAADNPFAVGVDASVATASGVTVQQLGSEGVIPPIWPTIVSGILFGLAHWGYGLSFIPLIALGILLGMLYRATQSIWPCIVVHFMLNASSMAALGLNVYMSKIAGE
ncbi:MAG: lysostaphin resistance A-like protein [Pirellulaceae bacterium]